MTSAEWHSTLFQFLGIIFSVATLIISIIAVYFTFQNLKEMRNQLNEQQKQYFEQNRGNLVFYITGTATSSFYSLVLKNFGNSPAKLLYIRITPDISWEKVGKSNLSEFNFSNLKNIFLAPKQHIGSSFNFESYPDKQFDIEIKYETCGKEYVENYSIDLNFQDYILGTEPSIKDSLSALKHINKSISSLSDKLL